MSRIVVGKIFFAYLLFLVWALVIFKFSSEVSSISSSRSDLIVAYIQQAGSSLPQDILTFLTRKAAHTIAYFIFGIMAYNVIRHYKLPPRRAILVSSAIVFTYALSDEFHQIFVPGRSGELRDVLIDTIAGIVAVVLTYVIHREIVRRRAKNRQQVSEK